MPKRGRPPFDDVLTPAEWKVVEAVRHGIIGVDELGQAAEDSGHHHHDDCHQADGADDQGTAFGEGLHLGAHRPVLWREAPARASPSPPGPRAGGVSP